MIDVCCGCCTRKGVLELSKSDCVRERVTRSHAPNTFVRVAESASDIKNGSQKASVSEGDDSKPARSDGN